jgi:hypothetical protein
MKDTIEFLNEVDAKGIFSFVAVTKQDALKKSRLTKLATPWHLETITKYTACTISMGNDYQDLVNKRLESEDKSADFSAGTTYCYPIAANKLVYKHAAKDQYYLRVYRNLCASFRTVVKYIDANGIDITAQWHEIQKEYFKLPSDNSNQGIDNVVIVNNYKLENVKFLKRGDILLDNLDSETLKVISGKVA